MRRQAPPPPPLQRGGVHRCMGPSHGACRRERRSNPPDFPHFTEDGAETATPDGLHATRAAVAGRPGSRTPHTGREKTTASGEPFPPPRVLTRRKPIHPRGSSQFPAPRANPDFEATFRESELRPKSGFLFCI